MFERIETIVDGINGREGAEDRRPNTPKDIWEAIRMLERGPRSAKDLSPMALQKDQPDAADGALCETPTETAEVMVKSPAKTISHIANGHLRSGRGRQRAPAASPAPSGSTLHRVRVYHGHSQGPHLGAGGGAPRSSTRSTRRSTKTQPQRGTSGR